MSGFFIVVYRTDGGDAAQLEGATYAAIVTIRWLYTNPGTVGIVLNQVVGTFLGRSQIADGVCHRLAGIRTARRRQVRKI